MQLSKHILPTRLGEASTGSTSVSEAVDMQNFEGVMFLGNVGTTGTAGTITVAHGASTTGLVNVTSGTQSSTGGNDIVVMDVYRPVKRYVQATLTTTASARISLFAMRYGPRNIPQSSTAAGTLVSPTTT